MASGKHDAVMEQLAIPCLVVNPIGKVDSVNEAAQKFLNITEMATLGKPITWLFPGFKEVKQNQTLMLASSLPGEPQFIIVINKVLVEDVEFLNLIIFDPPRTPAHNIQAISLGHILEHSLNEILIFDSMDQNILEANQNCLTNTGYSRPNLIGVSANEIIKISEEKDLHVLARQIEHSGDPYLITEARVKRIDATEYPVNLRLQTIEYHGTPSVAAIYEDLSWKQQIQTDLGESQDRLTAIFKTAIDGIIVIDERGIIEMVNPSAARLFGHIPDEMLGNNVSMLMAEPDHSDHDKYMQSYIHTGVEKIIGIGREVFGKKKNGTQFPFRLGVSEVQIRGRRAFIGMIHDISDVKKAEEKLRRYARDLERSNKELESFAYISSHDLQEPLRKIRAFGDRLLVKESDQLSEKGQDYLNRMVNAAERMQRLIDDLLTFSRLTTRANPFEETNLDIILKEVLSDLEVIIEKSGAEVSYSNLPVIEAEPTQIRQLFQNLISNAIKFHKPGQKPTVEISHEVWSPPESEAIRKGEEFIRILVKDNGIGIEEKYATKVFQIFQRLGGREIEGSGIGLAICKKITDRHGGYLKVESPPGQGTIFIIILPVKHEQSGPNTNSGNE